ncbi:hypothetical protein Rhopal_002294-T1 [Rhodotorula paludigena]|uniref:t-SNARE coiled-coil homology domain-containing protein n=1 Tax=Rhodotorula paludigena TaxID=86838 RepID=A0AAV5GJC9_9BASI|nr:hypothetical protein Rhopal_002294-T1 [Rhodotorula paludigena]
MSDDPYFEVKAEVEAALAQLSSTHAQLGRASPNSEERSWALAELKATLAAVVPDLEELEESVAALEEVGVARRLGIADKEVRARRDFVERARGEIADAKRKRYSASSSAYPPSYHTNAPEQSGTDGETDPNAEFEMQHQTLLMEQQDRTLTDISGTVGLLREQAHLMGREVFEQNRPLQ